MNGSELTTLTVEMIEAEGGKATNIVVASRAGNGDVIACLNGRYMELEIKGDGDTEKALQTEKLNSAITAGGIGMYIKSKTDIKRAISMAINNTPCPLLKSKLKSVTL